MRLLYPLIFCCICIFFLGSCKKEEKKREIKPIEVNILTVGAQDISPTSSIGYSGRITANKSVNLSFQVSGTIEQFPVSMGDFVQQGSLIASIDGTTYQNQYETRQAQAELARENFERINEVYQKGSIAEIKMIEARSNYKQAKAAADASYENVKHTNIYAPFSGYVGEKMMETGDVASPGRPVLQFLDIDLVKATIPIPDQEVNQYKTGTKAMVNIEVLHKEYEGLITEVSIQSNQANPVYSAKISIPNPQQEIKPGMSCEVYLNEDTLKNPVFNQVIVPVETVSVTEDHQKFVFVVNQQNKVERRLVKTGKLYDNGIAITKGLQNGEQLVTSGYHKLTDNTPVKIVNPH